MRLYVVPQTTASSTSATSGNSAYGSARRLSPRRIPPIALAGSILVSGGVTRASRIVRGVSAQTPRADCEPRHKRAPRARETAISAVAEAWPASFGKRGRAVAQPALHED